MGGVVNTVSNFVGNAIDTVLDNPEILPIALTLTGNPELAFADTFGSSTAEEILANELASSAAAAAGTEYGLDTAAALTDYSDALGNIYTPDSSNPILSDVGVNTGDTFGSSTADDLFGGTTNVGDTFGSSTAGEIEASGGFTNWEDYIKNLPSMSSSVDTGGIIDALSKLGSSVANTPSIPATLYAGLALADQRRINNQVMNAYNLYQADKLRKKQQYQTGVGLPSLPTTVGGIPLAQAQPRTAAQTVVRAAKGGSISDLYNEYSQLNNRMRNYRRLAKGGLI